MGETRLERFLCAPETPIREALRRIDATTPNLFQVVVDADGKVVGTVTDGDVRRAMLRNVGLDEPVSRCMNDHPIVGSPGAPDNHARLHAARFLPIVDERGRILDIMAGHERAAAIAHALVMAGGFGRRLGERTRARPKPLLEVGRRPILEHVLAQLEGAGVGAIDVAVHYLADQIDAYLAARPSRADIRLIREADPLGTAGALGRLTRRPAGPVLVVNGDVLTRVDYAALVEFHERNGYDATVGAAVHEVRVPYGVLRHSGDGLLEQIDEKPAYQHLVAAGIYYLSPDILAMVPGDRALDMPELLDDVRRAGLRIGLFPVHEYWIDVGQAADLEAANNHHEGA